MVFYTRNQTPFSSVAGEHNQVSQLLYGETSAGGHVGMKCLQLDRQKPEGAGQGQWRIGIRRKMIFQQAVLCGQANSGHLSGSGLDLL